MIKITYLFIYPKIIAYFFALEIIANSITNKYWLYTIRSLFLNSTAVKNSNYLLNLRILGMISTPFLANMAYVLGRCEHLVCLSH